MRCLFSLSFIFRRGVRGVEQNAAEDCARHCWRGLPAVVAPLLFATTALAQMQDAAWVHHAPTLNARIEGSLQQMLPESVTLNGNGAITGSLLIPGSPTVKLNGKPAYGGAQSGNGVASPNNHTVTLNGNAALGRLVTRTNAVVWPASISTPAPTGSRSVSLSSTSQTVGSFSTVRNLTLNGNVGQVAIPPQAYGDFVANGNSGFTLGIAGASQPALYSFQHLALNGNSALKIVGPVIVTVANAVVLNGSAGDAGNPAWLQLRITSGGLTLNGNVSVHGYVTAPAGSVTINGNSELTGGVVCDGLTLNGNSLLKILPLVAPNRPPTISLAALGAENLAAPATVRLIATASDAEGSVTRVEFWRNGTKAGETTHPPFEWACNGLAAGNYRFTAWAFDGNGASAESSAIAVNIAAALPYLTGFESSEGFLQGALNRQGGWSLMEGEADIASNAAQSGSTGLSLKAGSAARAEARLSLVPSKVADARTAAPKVAFIDFYAKPAARTTAGTSIFFESSGAKLALIQTAAGSSAVAVVDGNGAGGGAWRTTEAKLPTASDGRAAAWTRFTVRLDFSTQRWDLYVEGRLSNCDLSLASPDVRSISEVSFLAPANGTSVFDSLYVGWENPLFADRDSDGMDDAWEVAYGLDLSLDDRGGDKDADGLTNIREFQLGSDPARADSDGDGFSDGDEVMWGWNPAVANPDIHPPSVPTGLSALNVITNQVLLSWQPATDDVRVAGYLLSRNGQPLTTPEPIYGTQHCDPGLMSGEAFVYQVRAFDFAGNLSGWSLPLIVRTSAADSDLDGLPDDWEANYFHSTSALPMDDPDGDGLTNQQECAAGSDPTDFYNGTAPITQTIPPPTEPADQLSLRVQKPEGSPWPNAPVRFAITTGQRRLSAEKNRAPFLYELWVRTSADGIATAFLEPENP